MFELSVELLHRLQQRIHMLEVMVVCHTPSHVAPDILLRIQFWRVGWQPFELNPVTVLLQQPRNGFRLVRLVVVDKEHHLALRVSRQFIGPRNSSQQSPKPHAVATSMDDRHRLAGDRIHCAPVPALRHMHARCQNDPLLTDARPAARDRWEQAHLGRISQEKDPLWAGLSFPVRNLLFSLRRGQGLAYA
jgi:hypothetical protein